MKRRNINYEPLLYYLELTEYRNKLFNKIVKHDLGIQKSTRSLQDMMKEYDAIDNLTKVLFNTLWCEGINPEDFR